MLLHECILHFLGYYNPLIELKVYTLLGGGGGYELSNSVYIYIYYTYMYVLYGHFSKLRSLFGLLL